MTDCGHYIEVPVEMSDSVKVVPSGECFSGTVVLRSPKDSLPFNRVVLSSGAKAELCLIILPGAAESVDLSADLCGEGAELNLSGIFLCGNSDKLAICTEVRHKTPRCTSNQMFNGLAAGTAKAEFHGRIVVAPGAQQTGAYQSNHNLLLSDKARIRTKPQLEIYADDVKCSHGATVGSLSEEEQFYMRSRGITEAEAKVLQMISFVSPVLEHVKEGRDALAEELENVIRQLAL